MKQLLGDLFYGFLGFIAWAACGVLAVWSGGMMLASSGLFAALFFLACLYWAVLFLATCWFVGSELRAAAMGCAGGLPMSGDQDRLRREAEALTPPGESYAINLPAGEHDGDGCRTLRGRAPLSELDEKECERLEGKADLAWGTGEGMELDRRANNLKLNLRLAHQNDLAAYHETIQTTPRCMFCGHERASR